MASSGLPIAGAHITVIDARTGANAAIYQDAAGSTSLANPFTAGSDGYYQFFADYGEYAVSVSADGMTELYRVSHVVLVDPTGPQAVCSSSRCSSSKPRMVVKSCSVSWCRSSRCRNRRMVVSSGTTSSPSSTPTNRRIDSLS